MSSNNILRGLVIRAWKTIVCERSRLLKSWLIYPLISVTLLLSVTVAMAVIMQIANPESAKIEAGSGKVTLPVSSSLDEKFRITLRPKFSLREYSSEAELHKAVLGSGLGIGINVINNSVVIVKSRENVLDDGKFMAAVKDAISPKGKDAEATSVSIHRVGDHNGWVRASVLFVFWFAIVSGPINMMLRHQKLWLASDRERGELSFLMLHGASFTELAVVSFISTICIVATTAVIWSSMMFGALNICAYLVENVISTNQAMTGTALFAIDCVEFINNLDFYRFANVFVSLFCVTLSLWACISYFTIHSQNESDASRRASYCAALLTVFPLILYKAPPVVSSTLSIIPVIGGFFTANAASVGNHSLLPLIGAILSAALVASVGVYVCFAKAQSVHS